MAYETTIRCDTGAYATRRLLQIECYGVARIRIFQRNHQGAFKLRCGGALPLSGGNQFNWDLVNLEIRKKYGGTVVDTPAEVRMEVWWIPQAGGSGMSGGIPDQSFEMFVGSSQTVQLVAPDAGLATAPSQDEGGVDEFGDFTLDWGETDRTGPVQRMTPDQLEALAERIKEESWVPGTKRDFIPTPPPKGETPDEDIVEEPDLDQEENPIPWGLIVAGLAAGAFLSR